MTSSASSVNAALAEYAAGKLPAERLVSTVAAAYYGETRNGKRETWRPIMDVVERAHPGIVELKATLEGPGFAIGLAEWPFPKAFEGALREAVQDVLTTIPVSRPTFPDVPVRKSGLFARIFAAIRSIFRST